MKRVNVLQVGLRRRYIEPVAFQNQGILGCLFTDYWLKGGRSTFFLRRATSRYTDLLPEGKVFSCNFLGVVYPVIRRVVSNKKSLDVLHYCFVKAIVFLYRTRIIDCDFIYAYSGEAIHLEKEIVSRKIDLVLDQKGMPRKFYRKVFEKEMGKSQKQFWDKVEEIEEREWRLAKKIVCGSKSVKNELVRLGVDPQKVVILPAYYAGDITESEYHYMGGVLKVLFVGNVNPLKGIGCLLEAARNLVGICEFTIIGQCEDRFEYLMKQAPKNVRFKGYMPNDSLTEEYCSHHLFLFPSLSEGSAMVIMEAMSCGLPVLCSEQSGSIITSGLDGEILNSVCAEEISSALRRYIQNPNLLRKYSEEAVKKIQASDFENYSSALNKALI